jgi:hypothetical protein
MRGKTKTAIISVVIITCLTFLLTVLAKPTPETSIEAIISPTPASFPEYSFVIVILGLIVLLTVFVAIVRQRVTNKTLKIGNTSNQ